MCNPTIYGDTFVLQTFKEALEADPPILRSGISFYEQDLAREGGLRDSFLQKSVKSWANLSNAGIIFGTTCLCGLKENIAITKVNRGGAEKGCRDVVSLAVTETWSDRQCMVSICTQHLLNTY
jgi:hypothetical protein